MPVVIGASSAAISWLRLPAGTRGTVWAEDGQFFLGDQLAHGTLGGLFIPYQGYVQLIPRLMTSIAFHLAPIADYALAMAATASVVVGLIAAGVWTLTAGQIRSPWARAAIALAPVLAPVSPVEILGNAANMHWFLLFLTPWLFLARPGRWVSGVILGVVALVAALTEIQMLFFAPLLLVRMRMPYRWPLVGAALAGIGCQLGTSIAFPREPPRSPALPPHDIALGYLLQPFPQAFSSRTHQVGALFAEHGIVSFVIALVALVALFGVGWGWSSPRYRLLLLSMFGGSIVVWSAALFVNHGPQFEYNELPAAQLHALGTSRYAAASAVFLIVSLVIAADALGTSRRRPLRPVGGVVLVALTIVFVAALPGAPTTRTNGPVWMPEVHAASVRCIHDARLGAVPLDTAPHPPWHVNVPCRLLRSG
jgi:hypothetical protein